jgi:hypothetical protein
MPSGGILRRVALVITDVSEERSASIIRVTRTGELGATHGSTFPRSMLRLLVPVNLFLARRFITLMMGAIRSSETSVLTRATRRNIPEDGFLQYPIYIPLLPMRATCPLNFILLQLLVLIILEEEYKL